MRFGVFAAYPGRNAGGPEMYECELLRALARIDKANEYHVFCFDDKAKNTINIQQDNFKYHVLGYSSRVVNSLVSLPLKWGRSGCSLLHATFMPPVISRGPYLFTLVCSSMFEHPELYPPAIRLRVRALCRLGLERARKVICISKDIQNHVQNRFNIPDERLSVIPLAASPMFRPLPLDERRAVVEEQYKITDPYFLFSGRWEQRKNILRIIEAFAQFKRDTRLPHKLVFSGLRTWCADQADALMDRLQIRSEVVDLGKSPVHGLPHRMFRQCPRSPAERHFLLIRSRSKRSQML
jgi:glycosyltransferase involved in cell wall biosynthesis